MDTLSEQIARKRRIAADLQDGDPQPRIGMTAQELQEWEELAVTIESQLDEHEQLQADQALLPDRLQAVAVRLEALAEKMEKDE